MAAPKLTKARIKKLASQPGTRRALPDSALTPAQRVQRRLNQPVAPGLTGLDLAKQTQAATALEFGGQERALAQQGQNITAQQGVTADYYRQYQDAIRQAAQAQQARQQAAVGQVQGLQQGMANIGAQQVARSSWERACGNSATVSLPCARD